MTDPVPDPLVVHCQTELQKLGEDDATIAAYSAVINCFLNQEPTVEISVLNDLLQWKNLTPLTSSSAEWNQVGPKTWQSTRNPEAFSMDRGKTYYLLSEGYMEHHSDTPPV